MRIAVGNRMSDWYTELKPILFPCPFCLVPPSLGPFWACVGSRLPSSHAACTSTQAVDSFRLPNGSQHMPVLSIFQRCVKVISFSCSHCPCIFVSYSFCVFLGVIGNDTCGQSATFNWNSRPGSLEKNWWNWSLVDLIKETNVKAQMHISHVTGATRSIPENKNCDFVIISWKLCGRVE